jgi:hypothetical protein
MKPEPEEKPMSETERALERLGEACDRTCQEAARASENAREMKRRISDSQMQAVRAPASSGLDLEDLSDTQTQH